MIVTTAIYTSIAVRNRPSFYAPPVAWAAADFTQRLIVADGPIDPPHTGLIVVSDECSLGVIRELSRTAALGTISPLRFAGASPSVVAGLPALAQGIRGPTLALTMRPEDAVDAVAATIDFWIQFNGVSSAIAIAHHAQRDGRHLFRGVVARSAGNERAHLLHLCGRGAGEKVRLLEPQCAGNAISPAS